MVKKKYVFIDLVIFKISFVCGSVCVCVLLINLALIIFFVSENIMVFVFLMTNIYYKYKRVQGVPKLIQMCQITGTNSRQESQQTRIATIKHTEKPLFNAHSKGRELPHTELVTTVKCFLLFCSWKTKFFSSLWFSKFCFFSNKFFLFLIVVIIIYLDRKIAKSKIE